jgi:hypothetical protein
MDSQRPNVPTKSGFPENNNNNNIITSCCCGFHYTRIAVTDYHHQ